MRSDTAYTKRERRAANMIWTAAEDYSFDPPFFAYQQSGAPDLYMNSVIGFVHAQYDTGKIDALFEAFSGTIMEELYDGLAWLALENAVFERMQEGRPALKELRLKSARMFFQQEKEKTRQQWMAQNSRLYAQQAAHWHIVLGEKPHLILPGSRELAKALFLSGRLDTEALCSKILGLFEHYLWFRPDAKRPAERRFHLSGRLAAILMRLYPSRIEQNELLRIRMKGEGREIEKSGAREEERTQARRLPRRLREEGKRRSADPDETLRYLSQCFGQSVLTEREQKELEHVLCTDRHAGCHVYLTDGRRLPSERESARDRKLRQDAMRQTAANRRFYESQASFFKSSARRLAAAVQNAMLLSTDAAPIKSRDGRLSASACWRAERLNDARIFTRQTEEQMPFYSVDILLDASASRLETQSLIAAQAYVIASGLQQCHVPVQVSSFLSLRGFTVVHRFCSYGETDRNDSLFSYYAAGWNRDGLALRLVGKLMEKSPAKYRLLLMLTDVSPNDDTQIPADPENGRPLKRSYLGAQAVADTKEAVAELKKEGVRVVGILTGRPDREQDARTIFGHDFVLIRDMRQFADAVGSVVLRQIEGMADV